jgi:hypothetical protein
LILINFFCLFSDDSEGDARTPRLRKVKNQLLNLRRMMILTTERKIRGVRVAATAVTAMTRTTEGKKAPIVKLAPRRLTLLDEATLVQTFAFDVEGYKLVYLWVATPSKICLVNFNLRRSYKVGLCRTSYLCEFIGRTR